jgi:hypothetical protein
MVGGVGGGGGRWGWEGYVITFGGEAGTELGHEISTTV